MAGDPAGAVESAASPPAATANKENTPPGGPQVVGQRDVLFGTRVRKSFGSRFFWGTIVGRYDVAGGAFYKVSFDDGDVDVFAANEVMEDAKQARRHAKEDKLRPTASASEASPEAQTEYQAEMRRPTLKRKRDEPGDGDIRVRLWGQRLYASIYTSDDRQTFLKDFLRTEDGQIGELESSGLVNVGDRIIAVNGATTVGMASWEISDMIRKARRPLWLLFARGDGTVPTHKSTATPVPAPGTNTARQVSSGAPNEAHAPSVASQSVPSTQGPSGEVHPTIGSESAPTDGGSIGVDVARACAAQLFPHVAADGNGQPRLSSQYPRSPTAPPAPLTAARARHGPTSSLIMSGRPMEVLQARAAEAATSAQHYSRQPDAPAQRSTQNQTGSSAASSHLAAVTAANKMLQLREALLQRQREQLVHHERLQEQLHRMGLNLPTNGLATTTQHQAVPALHPVNSGHPASAGQWNSHPRGGSTALVPAPSNNFGAAPMTRAQPMMVATFPMPLAPPVANPALTSWVSAQQQQGWASAPAQAPYSTVANNPASGSMHSDPHQAARPRFEVVDGTTDAPPTAHSSTSSPPQVSPSAASSLHALSDVHASDASASTPRTSSTEDGAALSSAVPQDEPEIDIDDDAAAIAALAGASPSKEASRVADGPTSFLSLATASVEASAASDDVPLVEGDNYFVVTIRKPRLYVTLGTLGSHVAVTSFVRDESGEKGEIEESGRVFIGDVIVGVNGVRLGPSMSPSLLAHLVNTTPRPMSMWFERASWDILVGST